MGSANHTGPRPAGGETDRPTNLSGGNHGCGYLPVLSIGSSVQVCVCF